MQAAACAFHAEREALGVCVACRSRVCAECTTKVEGINYCVRCLAARARAEAESPTPVTTRSVSRRVAVAITFGLCLWALVWALLELGFPEAA